MTIRWQIQNTRNSTHAGSSTEYFVPIFRTHGHRPQNEIWAFDKVEPILIQYDKLRYRLMPYIYSLAWRVTNEDYTIQRPLVMDWRTDPNTRDIGDEFMFGPAILVSPVLQPDATHRTLYLPDSPAGTTSGRGPRQREAMKSMRTRLWIAFPSTCVPVRFFPLVLKSSTPSEKPAGPIELRIYAGPTQTSICIRIRGTATTMKRARIRDSVALV